MAVTEQLILDLSRAQSQIRELDRELDALLTPVTVPVELDASGDIQRLRRELDNVDANVDIDVSGLRAVDEAADDADRLERSFAEARTQAARVADQADRIKREMRQADAASQGFGTRVRDIGAALAVFQGARAGFEFLAAGVQDAAALAESINRINVLFGDTADEVLAFSENSTAALVLTQRELLDAVGTFGGLASVVGLAADESVEFSTTLTDLAADLASFGDTSPQEAIDALGSALRGESEPIRRYNVLLNEATINAKGLELGLGGVTGELSESEKVQARYAVILEQTATAQGDLLETQDSLSNRLKNTRVRFLELRQELGQAVIPALEDLVEVLPGVIDLIGQAAPVVGGLASEFGNVIEPVAEFAGIIGELTEPLGGLTGLFFDAEEGARSLFGSFIDFMNPLSTVLREVNSAFKEAFPDEVARIDTAPIQGALVDYDKLGTAVRDVATEIRFLNEVESFDTFSVGGADELLLIGEAAQSVNQDLIAFREAFGPAFTDLFDGDFVIAEFDAISQALADTFSPEESGEILATVDELVEDIAARFEELAEFESGLAELVSLGFDDAAEVIRQRGPEAIGLVRDALSDPSAVAGLETLLESVGTPTGAGYAEGFQLGFEAETPEIAATIAASVDSETVRQGIIAGAKAQALIYGDNFNPQIIIDDFTIQPPANVQPFTGGGGTSGGGGGSSGPPTNIQGSARMSVVINNPTVTDLDTSVGQASSTLGAISGLVN